MKNLAIAILIVLFAAGLALRHWPFDAPGQLTAVVVEDSAHRTPAIAAVLTAPEVLQVIGSKAIVWHVIDKSESGPDLAEVQFALDAAKNKSLPVLVTRREGQNSKVAALPSTPAALVKLLAER